MCLLVWMDTGAGFSPISVIVAMTLQVLPQVCRRLALALTGCSPNIDHWPLGSWRFASASHWTSYSKPEQGGRRNARRMCCVLVTQPFDLTRTLCSFS